MPKYKRFGTRPALGWGRPGSTFEDRCAAFEKSVGEGGYGDAISRWPAYVNKDVLASFEAAQTDWLDRDRFVERYGFEQRARLGPGYMEDGLPSWSCYRDAGNVLHWAMKLGIVGEETRDGIRGWALLNHKPIWALDHTRPGAQLIRLQGGDAAERAERARRAKLDAAREKLRATLARKACQKALPNIAWEVASILEHEPTFRVPEVWCTLGYVPGAFAGAYLSACAPTVKEACVTGGFDKDKLHSWLVALTYAGVEVRLAAYAREEEAEKAAQREDDAALAGLADLGGL